MKGIKEDTVNGFVGMVKRTSKNPRTSINEKQLTSLDLKGKEKEWHSHASVTTGVLEEGPPNMICKL